jgi:hypothetical protein
MKPSFLFPQKKGCTTVLGVCSDRNPRIFKGFTQKFSPFGQIGTLLLIAKQDEKWHAKVAARNKQVLLNLACIFAQFGQDWDFHMQQKRLEEHSPE